MTTLQELAKLGQSPWYDNISRGLIKSGGLRKLIDLGILGVTTNPTIFEKSLAQGADYDRQIEELSHLGKSALDIYDELAADDVRDACDVLKEVYERSGQIDGFVSIEVLPEYADDAAKTVDYAKHIASKVGRPNVMVKVPATEAGVQAIRALVREGININATLIFSLSHYRKTAQAYIHGIADRQKDGNDAASVRSVASVFVSRVDTAVDKMLAAKSGADELKGKAAVANCKMIYSEYKKIFQDKAFASLAEGGAKVQRLLWASTGTKDPGYSDIKYVEELIGKDTINTMPQQTLDAFLDHGALKPAAEDGLSDAKKTITALASCGINVDEVCKKLQEDGVAAFASSFDALINSIERKRGGHR